MQPAEERSTGEKQAAARADTLIEEFEAADVIVIAAPTYIYLVCPPSLAAVPVADELSVYRLIVSRFSSTRC
jgi:hypothetical protein